MIGTKGFLSDVPKGKSDDLIFYVNGKKICLQNVNPEITLATFLRRHLLLTGTKVGCDEGSCGSCTVMISDYDKTTDTIRHKSVTSCLVPICSLHGLAVTTVEALGNLKSGLNPIQERLVKYHGTQCGFCTPGMVMSMYTLLRNNPHPTLQQITNNLHGNVCRCTGYRSIIGAFGTFAKDNCCSTQDGCCSAKQKGGCCSQEKTGSIEGCPCQSQTGEEKQKVSDNSQIRMDSPITLDPTQELIFPPELKLFDRSGKMLCFDGPNIKWYRPGELKDVLDLLSLEPNAIIAAGFTNIVHKVKGSVEKRVIVDISGLDELKGHTVDGLGSGLTITEVIDIAERYRTTSGISSILLAIPQTLQSWHIQLKNSATLGGHIMLRKPYYDLLPLLIAGECYVTVASKDNTRFCPINMEFLENKDIVNQNEIVTSVRFPPSPFQQFVRTYRVAKRKHQDFASLSAAFVLDLSPTERLKVNGARIVFGGNIPKVVVAKDTQMLIGGRIVTESSLSEALRVLEIELSTVGFSDTQIQWAQGFLTKCLLEIMTEDNIHNTVFTNDPKYQLTFKSKQFYEISKEGDFSRLNVVGEPMTHSSAEEQATGEAIFIDDIAPSIDELFLHSVLSTRAHATITGIDLEAALAVPGVHGYVDSTDVPGVNSLVPRYREEELFATTTVHHHGQIILGIVADDRESAMKASSLVKISYQDKQPVIHNIQEAMSADSYMSEPTVVKRGDTEAGFRESDMVLEGELYLPGQKHLYMETNTALVTPKERGEIEVLSGTQMPHELQSYLSQILSVSDHKVCVRVKRMGGAFGGKETRSFLAAFPAAVAAVKYKRPVRCVLTRRDDTQTNGGRHPAYAKYKVGFKNDGKIVSLEWKVYVDGGCTIESSDSVIGLITLRAESPYNIPSVRIEGRVCRTNNSSKGAFRGFGVPQISWMMENVITAIATKLSTLPEKIRELNMYFEGETTLSGVLLKPYALRTCWAECKTMAKFEQRLKEIEEFNRSNTRLKRGLSMSTTMYGIGIFVKFLNQAGALVNVYTDGSVLVTHGGCEMGQGLHTKIKQIASETLGIDYNKVLVSETSTNFVPNATPSGASLGTDINGGAVHAACLTLLERLRPFREVDPSAGWNKWVNDAYFNRVNLSATGFYKFGDFNFDFATGKGSDCMYYTYGAACSEVEVDCLTGEHKLLRTDIVMEVGRSLNPAIDIGQIEGGFVQGYGHWMLEDVVYSDEGRLLTDSPLTYKVPLCSDIPAQFNVALLKNTTNNKAIYSSKGIGEPPLLLSLSAYLALREAVKSAREEKGLEKIFVLECPAIPANVFKCLSL